MVNIRKKDKAASCVQVDAFLALVSGGMTPPQTPLAIFFFLVAAFATFI